MTLGTNKFMMAEKITWESVGQKPNPVLSPAWSYKDLIFASGTLGCEDDGTYSNSIERQIQKALENLEKVLKAAGSSLQDTLKIVVFLNKAEDIGRMNTVYAKFLPHKPARSCFGINFPNKKVLVEIEAVAFKPKAKL